MGIGEALAYGYCNLNAKVLLLARTEEKLKKVCSKCKSRCEYVVADFSNVADEYYSNVVKVILQKMNGRIDTVILNHVDVANNFQKQPWMDFMLLKNSGGANNGVTTQTQFTRKLFDVNMFSYFSLSSHLLPYLEQSGGNLGVVSSTAGLMGMPHSVPYSACKHAIVGYYEALRSDMKKFKRHNVSITIAHLGGINTENAVAMTRGTVSDYVVWHPVDECAKNILVGVESKARNVYYPYMETRGVQIMKTMSHQLMEALVLNLA